jgi:alkylation response protein AidB-like acyl-CoA dehydrogenase
MNFLTEEQQQWKDTVERWIDKEIGKEYIRKCDVERQFPFEAYEKAAKMGWMKLLIPEEDGGDGADIFSYALMCEALAKYGVDFCIAITASTFNVMSVVKHGTREQKRLYVEPFMRGEIRIPVSISEPNAGSDAFNTQTKAVADGDYYVINGQKIWCSGAANKGAVIMMLVRTAKTENKRDGLSVFMIPNDTPGLDIRPLPTLPRRSVTTTEIFLQDVRVHKSQMLGKPGDGGKIIGGELQLERIAIAAGYTGNAQAVVNESLAYTHQRVQFGKPLFEFQVVRHMLADMQTQTDAARLLTYRAAEIASKGVRCAKEIAMAKLFSSETLQNVSRMGMQILGGYGTLPEFDMERHFREGMQATIGGGTSQMQRNIISHEMRIR